MELSRPFVAEPSGELSKPSSMRDLVPENLIRESNFDAQPALATITEGSGNFQLEIIFQLENKSRIC
jgi:hypothetical protein